ncbi:hypothetical protein ACVXHA_19405 [Escherichia coli]
MGKPTCVNNVKIPVTFRRSFANGVEEWYQNISKKKDAGTKLIGLLRSGEKSGSVGTAVLVLPRARSFEDYAGGMRDGLKN